MRLIAVGLAMMLTVLSATAHANDSGSALAAGGLVLIKTDGIAMQREDLTLSPGEVRVRYEMRNDRGTPVTMRVAFPMPEVPRDTPGGMETSGGADNIAMDPPSAPNFMNFRVIVAGKEITPQIEVRAVLPDGRDVAAALREIGGWPLLLRPRVFQLSDDHPGIAKGQFDLDAATRAKLVALHALYQDDGGYETLWRTMITFHWMQTFAPGVTIVEHSYTPVLGFHLMAPDAHNDFTGEDAKTYCIDKPTNGALRALWQRVLDRRKREQPDDVNDRYIPAYSLAYILHTAGNWDGPIGQLHLTLRGGLPASKMLNNGHKVGTMSLCTDLPLKKTGPDQFEALAPNYQPKSDLNVLMIPD